MEIRDIPDKIDGLNVTCVTLTGSNSLTLWADGSTTGQAYTRQNFIIMNDHAIPTGVINRTNSGYRSTYTCLDKSVLTYSPESTIYFQFISILLILGVWLLIYRLIIRRLLP